jgi:ABC-type multidrug transport system ATPase subunit
MSVLKLIGVSKTYRRGRRERAALSGISLEVAEGEFVAVVGQRRSGRTTLLRVAGGIEPPDEGRVLFDGRDLGRRRPGEEIGFVHTHFVESNGELVREHVSMPLVARGLSLPAAGARVEGILERFGALGCADLEPRDLDAAELIRVRLARALLVPPRLLLVDEPVTGVDLVHRDSILKFLRATADQGIAVLMTVSDVTEITGVDRAVSISHGKLHGDSRPREAEVLPLARAKRRAATRG